MIYHTKWSILVQKTAALLMPDFDAKKYRKTSVALEKLLHLFFSSMKKAKSYFRKMTEETPSSF